MAKAKSPVLDAKPYRSRTVRADGRDWNPNQLKAAVLRGTNHTWAQVAADLGLAEATVRAYTSVPEWQALVQEVWSLKIQDTVRDMLLPAFETLRAIFSDPDPKAAAKAVDVFLKHQGQFLAASNAQQAPAQQGTASVAATWETPHGEGEPDDD